MGEKMLIITISWQYLKLIPSWTCGLEHLTHVGLLKLTVSYSTH